MNSKKKGSRVERDERVIQVLEIEGVLPGLNDILRIRGRHSMAFNSVKKRYENEIGYEILACKIKPVERASFHFLWREPNKKRDKDNICAGGRKFILDALVKCGILVNDGWAQIESFSDSFEVSDNSGVTVTITS